jgi:hypothetical protein
MQNSADGGFMERRQTLQCMRTETPPQIESLFERHPLLSGFCIARPEDVPDDLPRSDDEEGLFVFELGVPPGLAEDRFKAIFEEVLAAVADLIGEQPDLIDSLRGRTFARTLH